MNQNLFIIYAEILLVLGIITLCGFNKSSNKLYKFVCIAFISIPIIFFYFTIFSHTNNIPFKDDYSLLESLYKMICSESFPEWSKAFFQQVNQHRFGFERSVMWLIYKVLGNENIKVQIILGNSFLIGIIYFFYKIFRNINLSNHYFTPLPLLLFNLTYFENAIWGIAAIQNTSVIFLALLTIHFLALPFKNSFYYSILFAIITLFTSGNGIAIWLVGILILFVQNRLKNLGIWILIMISIFSFYFMYDYEIIPSNKVNLIKHPFLNIQYTLAFWGNVFFRNIPHSDFGHRYWDILLCILTGIFLTVIILILFRKVFKNKSHNLSYITILITGGMLFLSFTGLMLVLSRPIEINILFGGEILSRRYMLFGSVFLGLGYLGLLYLLEKKKSFQKLGLICFIPIGLILNISSYYTSLSDVYKQQQELKLDGYYWKNHKMLLSFGEKYGEKIGYNHPTYMINLITKLDSSGIYKLLQTESLPVANLIRISNSNTAKKFEGKIDTAMSRGITIARENREIILFKGIKKSKNQSIQYFALKSQNNVFLFPAVPKRNSIKDCLITQSLNSHEFNYEIWKAKFPSDNYEVWLIEKDNQNNLIPLYTQKIIKL
jgi:hypothetical protein